MLFTSAISEGYSQSLWMRKVPIQFQGRIFSMLNVVLTATTMIFVYLGGVSVEKYVNPALTKNVELSTWLKPFIGVGNGRGIGLVFILCGIIGIFISLIALTTHVKNLDLIVPDNKVDVEG
jgi:diaminobutyrate-2-oxoglutarate transaminase